MTIAPRTKPKRALIPQGVRFDVFRRDNFTCQYCGQKSPDVTLECDHIVAVANGGSDDPSNLITACFDCNRGKGTKTVSIAPTARHELVGHYGLKRNDRGHVAWRFTIVQMLGDTHCMVKLQQMRFDVPESLRLVSLADLSGPDFSLFADKDEWIWAWAQADARASGKDHKWAEASFVIETGRGYGEEA